MLYTVNLDENNYILSVSHTENDSFELNLNNMDTSHLNAYQILDGKVYLDENRYEEITKEQEDAEKEEEILDLKQKLADSDYIFIEEFEEIAGLSNPLTFVADAIKIFVQYSSKYKEIIANRKAWRKRLEELES